jgi:hypothetical protein
VIPAGALAERTEPGPSSSRRQSFGRSKSGLGGKRTFNLGGTAVLAPRSAIDKSWPMISLDAGRSAVRRALWFASAVCILVSVMLIAGVAAFFGLKPAVALWMWIGLQPNVTNLATGLATLAVSLILLIVCRWLLRLNVVEDRGSAKGGKETSNVRRISDVHLTV